MLFEKPAVRRTKRRREFRTVPLIRSINEVDVASMFGVPNTARFEMLGGPSRFGAYLSASFPLLFFPGKLFTNCE